MKKKVVTGLMLLLIILGIGRVQAAEFKWFENNEDAILGCQEEATQNIINRYLMEADDNEGETEMRIYAEIMTQNNIETVSKTNDESLIKGNEELEKRLLDAQLKFPQSRHIQEAIGWFYQGLHETLHDKSYLAKAAEAFNRAENLFFEHSVIKLFSPYADLMVKILIALNDKEKLNSYFSIILERYPADMIAHLSYAKALSSFSDARAEIYFNKAISLKDDDIFQPTVDYVEYLLDRGKYKQAMGVLEKEKSEAYYLHFLKGYSLEKLGKYKNAKEEYRSYRKFGEGSSFGEVFFNPDGKYKIPNSTLQREIGFKKDALLQTAATCPNPSYSIPCSSTDWECKMRTYAVWTINGEAERNNGTLGMMRAVAWNIRNRVFSPTSSVYCPGQFVCTNYAFCYPISSVKWPSDPGTLYQRYFQVINTGGYAGLQYKTYTRQSEQVFFDVFNGTVPDPFSGKCSSGKRSGDVCNGTCPSCTNCAWGSFFSYTTGMEFRAGRLKSTMNPWGHCYEFNPMGDPPMGNCSSVPCFTNKKLICPRYATENDRYSCYSVGSGYSTYTGPVYGNFFWSTNGGTN